MPLIERLYKSNLVGCCLHVLLDDGNYGKSTAEFCAELAREQGHPECESLAGLLAQMSPTQQRKANRSAKRQWTSR